MSSFPLLSLPSLVIWNVIDNLNTEETLDLSMCSRKSRFLVRACTKNRYELKIRICYENKLVLYSKRNPADKVTFAFENYSVRCDYLSVAFNPLIRYIPYHRQSGTFSLEKEFIEYFLGTFRCVIDEIYLFRWYIHWICFRDLIDYFSSLQTSVRYFFLGGYVEKDDLDYFLNTSTVSEHLSLELGTDHTPGTDFYIDLYSIILWGGGWMNLDHFLKINFTACFYDADTSLITPTDWLILMNSWINGWNRRMKIFEFQSHEFNFELTETMLEQVPGQRIDKNVVRFYESPSAEFIEVGEVLEIYGGYDIRRAEDGVVATVVRHPICPLDGVFVLYNLSFISRGLDTCKKHGMDARVHPKDEDEVILTRQMFDKLTQERQEERSSITRF
ncbi:hypothetical protein GCK72_013381 [Caenorhabditis remanei]|uniref:F-box domain-containing protein n=1 Tax=Caenorhabditis remanei TaxID=31234 RepID=A0A6A5GNZ3_CAERE|nr:hypothetical protein GCK72_013381 [Caenorhabditis remanei]KAF1756927.1 hypothetical protein GCK72_013381 [Caenorhabditis remanei]